MLREIRLPTMSQFRPKGSESGIKTYLREIGQIPLLSVEKERELAVRIRQGDEHARDLMIRSNLRLVVMIAFEHVNRGMALPDLISDGNIGLVTAVERYDPAHRTRFSTYACWWIKQHIHRALANNQTIRIPEHITERIIKMRRVSAHMAFELGRTPRDEELAEELGLSPSRVEQIRRASFIPVSLNAPVASDDSAELADLVCDSEALTPFDQTRDRNQADTLNKALALLTDRERKIIAERFGLDGSVARTLNEIAGEIGLTRERVRQVEGIALRKLRRILRERESFPQAFLVTAA